MALRDYNSIREELTQAIAREQSLELRRQGAEMTNEGLDMEEVRWFNNEQAKAREEVRALAFALLIPKPSRPVTRSIVGKVNA
jgi:hypothetical protein